MSNCRCGKRVSPRFLINRLPCPKAGVRQSIIFAKFSRTAGLMSVRFHMETVLMMAHSPVEHERTHVHFSEVLKPQLVEFLTHGTVSRADNATFTPADAELRGFRVPALQE